MSAEEYVPTMGEVRADYVRDHTRNFDEYQVGRTLTSQQAYYGDQFDRWLAAHDAEVTRAAKAEAWDEAIEHGERWGLIAPGEAVNPYRKEVSA